MVKQLSKIITFLRGPMSLLIICIHADFTKNFSYGGKNVICHQDIGYHVVNFISHSFSDFTVPLFYIISGILYCNSIKKYKYKDLIKQKVKTLLFPYLLWNIIFFVLFFWKKGYTGIEFIKGLWYIPKGEEIIGTFTQPWDGPLWFLRDLIIIFCLTPIIHFFIRKIAFIYIPILLFLYITKVCPWYIIPGLSITSLLMFSIGIYLQQTGYNWLVKIKCYRMLLLLIFLILSISTYMYSTVENSISITYNLLHSLAIFSGIGAAFSIACGCNIKSDFVEKIGNHTFVIFASHTLFLTYLIKIVMLPFGYEISNEQTLIIYFSSVILTYVITYFLGELISKNRFLNKLLAGGR